VANALSRSFPEPATADTLLTLSSPIPSIIIHLKDFYAQHQNGKALLQKCATNAHMAEKYKFQQGLLYFKERIFVPDVADLRQ